MYIYMYMYMYIYIYIYIYNTATISRTCGPLTPWHRAADTTRDPHSALPVSRMMKKK